MGDEFTAYVDHGILTVGFLRELLNGRSDQEQVVIATGDWYTNVQAISVPHWVGDDNESDWSCVTLHLGNDFDSRQL